MTTRVEQWLETDTKKLVDPPARREFDLHGSGHRNKFVGVYSGRLAAADPLDAQLGIAWPASLVSEIVSGQKRDDLSTGP